MFSHIPCMALEEPGIKGLGRRAVILEAWVLENSRGDAGISIPIH